MVCNKITMTNTINFNKITDSLLGQTMDDVFNEFFKLEELLNDSSIHMKNWVVIRLVTIIEQFCREIIKIQIDNNDDIQLPEKLHINMDDLDRAKNLTPSFLITSQYNFQNIYTITKELKHYKINHTFDKEYKNDLEKLFDTRHNLVHTISPQNYDVKAGYFATKNLLKSILKESPYGLIYYENIHGLYFVSNANYDRAMRCFISAVKIKPDHIDTHYYIGLLHYFQKNIEDAYDRSTTIMNIDPTSHLGYYLKGLVFAEQGKYVDAINCYDQVIEIQPDYIGVHYQKCKILFKLNKFDDALLHGNIVIQSDSEYDEIILIVAQILVKLNRHNESLKLLNEKIKSYPDNADLHYEKYVVLSKLGKNNESKQSFDEAIRLNPDGEYPVIPSNDKKENIGD